MPGGYVFNGVAYAGQLAGERLLPAIANSRTINAGLCRLMPNLLGPTHVLKQDIRPIFQDMAAPFAADGETIRSMVTIDPKPMSVMVSFDQTQLLNNWEITQIMQSLGAKNINQPVDLAQAISTLMERRISQELEALFWGGKKSMGTNSAGVFKFTAAYTGVIDQALASTEVSKGTFGTSITGSAINTGTGVVTCSDTNNLEAGDFVTIASVTNASTYKGESIVGQSFKVMQVVEDTSFKLFDAYTNAPVTLSANPGSTVFKFINRHNVATALQAVIELLPTAVTSNPQNIIIAVPAHVFQAYQLSQAKAMTVQNGTVNLRQGQAGKMTDDVLGYRLEMIPSGRPNSILAYEQGNLIWGTAATADYNSLWIKDMFEDTGSMYINYRANFSVDGAIAFPDEVALVTA